MHHIVIPAYERSPAAIMLHFDQNSRLTAKPMNIDQLRHHIKIHRYEGKKYSPNKAAEQLNNGKDFILLRGYRLELEDAPWLDEDIKEYLRDLGAFIFEGKELPQIRGENPNLIVSYPKTLASDDHILPERFYQFNHPAPQNAAEEIALMAEL